ncbi:aminotransferase class I/II-fold pyridoxal phosphate-dependent enzyme [Flavobacteriaceae bacterium]|nr:aminotransferase class I/II-fold pyridoxal phosphate-dependent enzyme [Flavobacteriaceae bacterium]
MIINLISDTVTKPTKEMLHSMFEAEVGDDVFMQDPTVNALQDKVAGMFGKESALFFPSGTMANQTAIKLHTQPGDQMICDKYAHVYNYEGGGAAFNSGVTSYLIQGSRGMFKAEQLNDAINEADNIHLPKSALVAIENTTNKGGGACWDFEELIKIKSKVKSHDLAFHLDGARLFNALVAKNQTPIQYGELFDTISICLSKGLGAPVGSLLVGTKKDMARALRIRKLFGGGMRQAGYLAAAGIFALDHHVNRLEIDHQHAKLLSEGLKKCQYVAKVEPVETNIVIFEVHDNQAEMKFMKKLEEHNILIISMGQGKLRMVTHLDFTPVMLEKTLEVLKFM